MPIFSVIIPIYKVEKYIGQCIQSVLNQTFKDFEVLCVDDCGGDSSIEIIKKYAEQDSRIKVLYHETNKGVGAARNTAIKVAAGKYTICIDSDDWWEPQCLQVVYDSFQKFKTNSIWFDANKYIESTQTICEQSVLQNREGWLTLTPENIANFSDYCFKAYLTESIRENNLYYPEGLTYEDGAFYFKYFTFNPNAYIIEDRLYNYRIRENSITQTTSIHENKMDNIFKILKHLKQFYVENDLYDKYKVALLKMINVRINLCIDCAYSEKSFELTKQFLEDYNFLQDYDVFNVSINPLVSVIVPICEEDANIVNYIKRIQSQRYFNMEIICVNNCGRDVNKFLEQLNKYDSRIKLIKDINSSNIQDLYNIGLEHSMGEYILFLDPKIIIDSYFVEKIVSKFIATGVESVWYQSDLYSDLANSENCDNKVVDKISEGYFNTNQKDHSFYAEYVCNRAYKKSSLNLCEKVFERDKNLFLELCSIVSTIYMIN